MLIKIKDFCRKIPLILIISINISLLSANNYHGKELVRVGYVEGYNFIYDMDSISQKGYGYDLLKEIEKKSNLVFEFVEVTPDAWVNFPSDKIDLLGEVYYTEEGLTRFDYIQPRTMYNYISLSTKKSVINEKIFYNDPASIDGCTVALYDGIQGKDLLDEYLKKNNISVIYVYGNKSTYLNLNTDLYLEQTNHYNVSNLNSVLQLAKYSSYLAVKKGNKELKNTLTELLTTILTEDIDFMYQLREKYPTYASSFFKRLLTREESELLKSKKLRIGYNRDCEPYQFTNDDGEADGFSVRIMKEILTRYSIDADFIAYNASVENPDAKNYDILLSILGDYDYLAQYFTPTNWYYESPLFFARIGEYDFGSTNTSKITNLQRVGLANYIHFSDNFFTQVLSNQYSIVRYDSYKNLLHDFETGAIENALFTRVGIEYLTLKDTKTNSYSPTDFVIPLSFLISNELSEDYIKIFNVLIDDIGKEKIDYYYMEETSDVFSHYSFITFIDDNITVLLCILFALVLLFFINKLFTLRNTKKTILSILNADSLTGVSSLYCFNNEAATILSKAHPNEYELITLDMDYFRTINMYMGSEVGTAVIKTIATALKESYPDNEALIARITADQFVILKKTKGSGFIQLVCMHTIIPALEDLLGENYHLSLSIGICIIDNTAIPVDTIIGRSNMARMKGKKIHKTTFHEFDDKMLQNYENITGITQKMERALSENEFYAVYQPKIDLTTFRICGAEALVRWKQRNGKIVYPDDFIPLFESNSFIVDLDIYMFEQVCDFIDSYTEKTPLPPISVNISAKTLEQIKPIEVIMSIADRHTLKPQQIEIEITESALVDSHDVFVSNIAKLKRYGFFVSIDDFGAGTSTLNRLTIFNADIVKLDKVFLDVRNEDKKEYIIVENVISMSKELNMKVVSEGVETLDQVKKLKEMGCDIAQGYFFEKPLSKEEFTSVLKENKEYTF